MCVRYQVEPMRSRVFPHKKDVGTAESQHITKKRKLQIIQFPNQAIGVLS